MATTLPPSTPLPDAPAPSARRAAARIATSGEVGTAAPGGTRTPFGDELARADATPQEMRDARFPDRRGGGHAHRRGVEAPLSASLLSAVGSEDAPLADGTDAPDNASPSPHHGLAERGSNAGEGDTPSPGASSPSTPQVILPPASFAGWPVSAVRGHRHGAPIARSGGTAPLMSGAGHRMPAAAPVTDAEVGPQDLLSADVGAIAEPFDMAENATREGPAKDAAAGVRLAGPRTMDRVEIVNESRVRHFAPVAPAAGPELPPLAGEPDPWQAAAANLGRSLAGGEAGRRVVDMATRLSPPAVTVRQLDIALQPEGLGTVNVRLRLQGDVMHVTLTLPDARMAEHLQADAQRLAGRLLHAEGTAASRVHISLVVDPQAATAVAGGERAALFAGAHGHQSQAQAQQQPQSQPQGQPSLSQQAFAGAGGQAGPGSGWSGARHGRPAPLSGGPTGETRSDVVEKDSRPRVGRAGSVYI